VSRRRAPRPAGAALRDALADTAPRTLLAEVQTLWAEACGPAVAEQARPVGEREGVVTVTCRTATWASELDLMQPRLLQRLNDLLPAGRVRGLRFTADAARHGGF
jgi:predicted nucleic acid-binding Zn ribbon protein